jgi:hypothetical protein
MKRVVAVALVVGAGFVPVSLAHADAPVAYDSYGADASATAVHLLGDTNSLSNFRNGFLDNAYPLAATHLDKSPATTAAATVADTGPGGGFIDFEVNGKLPQTQYALAGSPGTPSATLTDQGVVVVAAATPTSADARAAVATTTTGGPTAKASPAAPVNADGDAGQSHVIFDGASVKASGASSLAHVALAGGLVTIDGLTVTASVVANATGATPAYAITAESVKVAGVAVSITDKGIVPIGANPIPVQALNQALRQAGLSITTTAPIITHMGANATVDATGITIGFTAPNPNPSIPTLTTKVILGEARAFAFATASAPVTPPPSTTPTTTGGTSSPSVLQVPPAAVESPAPIALPATPPPPAAIAVVPASTGLRMVTTRSRPTMLLWLFLGWQVIILANGAAVVWWRRKVRA